ncbi:hypothetical protein AB0E88_18840 [Streptomyces sp. NPDC028635]|uniref:hypothetical protein n=1 Tax=Streptomyces sp. NPDC028635 TaxID=3154800 RepID=UPI0033D6EC08
MAGRTPRWGSIARCGAGAGLAAVWWWAVLRLALSPAAGALEGAVVAGGWGLSVLPVHCVPKRRAAGAVRAGRWREAWRGSAGGGSEAGRSAGGGSAAGGSAGGPGGYEAADVGGDPVDPEASPLRSGEESGPL